VRNVLAIWRREVSSCLLSPVAYATMIAFLLLVGATFVSALVRHAGTTETPGTLLFSSVVLWLTLLVAVVSMRLFAEENRSGTLETLMTAPVTESQVVLGKYAGGLTFLLLAVAPTVAYLFVLRAMNPAMGPVDLGALGGGAGFVVLIAGFCLSVGLVISILTRNQIIAAICCFCAVWLVLLFGWLAGSLPVGAGEIAARYDAMQHLSDFTQGIIDSRAVVLYASATVFVLFVAVRLLEWRRWA